MANPIFGRGEGFTKHSAPVRYAQPNLGQQGYPQAGYGQQAYGHPGFPQQGFGPQANQYAQPQQYQQQAPTGAVMTYDDVIAKTGFSLGVVFLVAAAAFMLVPPALSLPVLIVSALAGFITVFAVGFRRTVGPVGLGIYAIFEGLFIGVFSAFMETMFPGIVAPAIVATFITAGVTLVVMKVGNIRVGQKFRQMVTIATIAFMLMLLVNLGLAFAGVDMGIRDIGSEAGLLSIGVSALAIILAVFNLVMDFDAVRTGVEHRAPASESWRAALGITVTMVWLYIEILRVASYLRD